MEPYYFPRAESRRAVVKLLHGSDSAPATDIVRLFVEALSRNRLEEARECISENYARDFDLIELSEYFSENLRYKRLQKAETVDRCPRNRLTSSIMVQEHNKSSIIHLHMIKEMGNWKIYDIDKE